MIASRGTFVHLLAYGAPDVFLFSNSTPNCYNVNDSMSYWFIDRHDGNAIKEDIYRDVEKMPQILDHVEEHSKPNGLMPFSIKKERAAVKIQNAWRKSITNPNYKICKKRLLNEFCDLSINKL